ncbi:type II toxin-antitoxin system HipA family toxin [Microbacterium luticocti]|uniref:type II toxin-antitoxin system HipA family toxin n=1 Tax=Microbacterium luticocti TaxID=451764 RepID=UPI001FE0EA31|nr:HipA domain-containing protein [Microbacterium luticocti]
MAKTAGGEFEHPGTDVPKLVALPRLMRAAEEAGRDDPPEEALKALLDAGSGSLGGARPKASIADDERLLIAKFGHSADEWDVMRWEKIVLDLAEHAGIACPRSSLVEVSGRAVLLIERFDRETGHRIGYISALTLLEADDGETHDYLDVADALSTVSPQASADLAQLWARIAFSVAVHNTDDHLRNHGFLRAKNGWRLSPVFDVNPDPDQHSRRTTIAGATDPVDEARALLDCAPLFGLTPEHAHATITRVIEAVSSWRTRAHAHRVTDHEITRFAPVFTQGLDALATVL